MKKVVLSYNDWVIQESKKIAASLQEVGSSVEATHRLAEALVKKEGFSDEEKMFFYILKESNMSIIQWQEEMLTEGFLGKLADWGKNMYDKGKEVITDVKDWAGQQIEGIPEFFKALGSGVKNLSKLIVDLFSKTFGTIFKAPIDYAKKVLGSKYTEIEKKSKEAAEKSPKALSEEVPHLIDIVKATPKVLSPKVIGEKFTAAMQKADSEKVEDKDLAVVEEGIKVGIIDMFTEAVKIHTVEEIKEGVNFLASEFSIETILEGDHGDDHGHAHAEIPFVSTVSGFLEKFQPFKMLSEIAEYFGDKANQLLTFLSSKYKEMGVIKETVKFTVLGALIGIALETIVKGKAKHAILHFFPPLKNSLTLISTIATSIAVVHVISNLIDGLKDSVEEMDSAVEAAH